MFKKFYIATLFLFNIKLVLLAQNSQVLVYTKNDTYQAANTLAIAQLQQSAAKHKIDIVVANDPIVFEEAKLRTVQAVVFINSSINELNYRQATELERFMKAGGGFVGIGATAEKTYQWLWFQKMIQGVLAETQLQNTAQFSLITNAFIGKTTLQPLWRLEDKPLIFNTLPVACKPVLLDIMGKTWAWYYTTEQGGKFFYTAFGTQASTYQNEDFINHIWAGIEETIPKQLPDYQKVADVFLPQENRFLKQVLVNNLTDALLMELLPSGEVLILEANGTVKLYNEQTKYVRTLGFIQQASLVKGLKLDPEFEQNKYVYTFEPQQNEYQIKRFQIAVDSIIVSQDFASQSSILPEASIKYNYSNYENAHYRLPKYYNNKTIRFDQEKGFLAETYKNEDLVNVEPFLPNVSFNLVKDITMNQNGELYVLENNQLLKIDYAEKNRKPIANATANVYEGTAPLTVSFSSNGSVDYDNADMLSYLWSFDATNISYEPNPIFTFQQAGEYIVSLKVSDTQGESSEVHIAIKVAKAGAKKKK